MSGLNSTMEDIGVNIQQLLFTDPFFCYFLSGIDRLILFKEDEDDPDLKGKFVPITGVGKSNNLSYALYVNADGWDKLKEVQRATGIQGLTHDQLRHEGLHISYTHPSIQGNYKHPDIFAVAADLEINQYLEKITAYNKLKDHTRVMQAIQKVHADTRLSEEQKKEKLEEINKKADPIFLTLDTFKWGDDKNQGTDYYYTKILEMCKKEDEKPGSQGAIGHAMQQLRDGGGEGSEADSLKKALGNGNWKDFTGQNSDVENEILNNKVKQSVKEILDANKNINIGNLPAGIQAQLQELMKDKPPVADWKRVLNLFAAKAISYYTKTSRRKPNKRHEEFAAIKIKSIIRIFVTIDTSGSMGSEGVKEVLSEVENIRKTNKALLDLGECDAELYVKEICSVGKQTIMTKTGYSGGGGTSVQPAIDYVNKNKEIYTLFIYLTDGWVPEPTVHCKIPMVTVITKDGASEAEVAKLRECEKFGLVIKTEGGRR